MNRLAVLNVVGLTEELIGADTPNISKYISTTSISSLIPPLPAVTSTVQSSILTGSSPSEHGIVANGWFDWSSEETHFWRQSNELVHGEKLWETLRKHDARATVANLFWWFNMYSTVDIAVTPRPMYRANGRKIPDIWTNPARLRQSLQKKFGQFPLFNFWGPTANINSSLWIANTAKEIEKEFQPTLSLVYLPHLDYPLQRVGPMHHSIPTELNAIDSIVGDLINYYSERDVQVCLLSEYGIEPVTDAVALNRSLRSQGLLTIREEFGREYLDAGASDAFAVPDHQVAHVYVRRQKDVRPIAAFIKSIQGVDKILVGKNRGSLEHDRCGDIVVISDHDKWFSHDWWNDSAKAPDYQQTVDIHKKPGYDPRELILADGWKGSKARIALKLLMRRLGSNTLLDVITQDASKVKGSHGRTPKMGAPQPIVVAPTCATKMPQSLPAAALKDLFVDWITS